MRVLIVEDEEAIADFVVRGLAAEGHEVRAVSDGVEGERAALEGDAELLILDLMLPGRDGMEILARVRESRPELAVILLTARGAVEDRVAGLDGGAADYLVKPFAFEELAARVRLQERSVARNGATVLEVGDLRVDLLARRVHHGETEIHLSQTEFGLLVHLMRHAGEPLSREDILRAVWGYEHDPGTNVVDVYVSYLRRKLGRTGRPAPISTVRSVGYRLES